MKVLEIGENRVVLLSSEGDTQVVNTREQAIAVLRDVCHLENNGLIGSRQGDRVRTSLLLAYKDIDSLEAFATDNSALPIDTRKQYRQKIVNEFVAKSLSASSTALGGTRTIHLIRGVTGSGKTTYSLQLRRRLEFGEPVETDNIKRQLFNDFWAAGAGMCPQPRQIHREASLICRSVVEELCARQASFIFVQRFEKIEDAERIVRISEKYEYTWHIYSLTPDYIDVARNCITRSRSLFNISTFSPESLQKSIATYAKTESYFYRLATRPFVLSMCDVRQQGNNVFDETFYKRNGANVYVNRNPAIHARLLLSRASREIEDYAIFSDRDMHRYQDFFVRDGNHQAQFERSALRILKTISRTAQNTLALQDKDPSIAQAIAVFHAEHDPTGTLKAAISHVYDCRYIDLPSENDLRNFIVEIAKRVTGLSSKDVFRRHDVGKYIAAEDISEHFNQFINELWNKLNGDTNRVFVAAYLLWTIDFTAHFFADGCSRVSFLLAFWYLARTGHDLPKIDRRRDKQSNLRSSYRGRVPISRSEIYDTDQCALKFASFYKYFKSLFPKPARPVIQCAGGYIFNSKGQILLLRSGKGKDVGKYVIPGGKMKHAESPDACFARETLEETGIRPINAAYAGRRRYISRSGRRYLMHDFTAQTLAEEVRLNHESIAYQWLFPVDISAAECTASTIHGLRRYLWMDALMRGLRDESSITVASKHEGGHATGPLAESYVAKKLADFAWALNVSPKGIRIHGIPPLRHAIEAILPPSDNLERRGSIREKVRNSNALRPCAILDRDSSLLHLFNFPGDDVLKHYSMLFGAHSSDAAFSVQVLRYPRVDDALFQITGLTSAIVHRGDVVYLGYSTRLRQFLIENDHQPISVLETFWYISTRFHLENVVLNVLECKFGHWGDIASKLTFQLCKLGARAIIHNGKVGTLNAQSEVYSRIYIPLKFLAYDSTSGAISSVEVDNMLSSFIPFHSGVHISCASPLEETEQFLALSRDHQVETVDVESSKIGEAVNIYNRMFNRNVKFGAIHYASDYVGIPDESFRSYNLSNEHDREPQMWKEAVLIDIFHVIISQTTRALEG